MRKGSYYEGGTVWQTEDGARAFIISNKLEDTRAVVLADWETDTLKVPRESYRRLLKTSWIVRLPDGRDGVRSVKASAEEADSSSDAGQS